MAFVELQPSTSQLNGIGTGVRVSVSGRNGLRISVADEALAILGGGRRGAPLQGPHRSRSGVPATEGRAGAGRRVQAVQAAARRPLEDDQGRPRHGSAGNKAARDRVRVGEGRRPADDRDRTAARVAAYASAPAGGAAIHIDARSTRHGDPAWGAAGPGQGAGVR